MSQRTLTILLAIFICISLAGVIIYHATNTTRKPDISPTPSAHHERSDVGSEEPAVHTLRYLWPVDGRMQYTLRWDMTMQMPSAPLKTDQNWNESTHHVTGMLHARVFSRTPDRVEVGFQLSDVTVTFSGQSMSHLATLYTNPLIITMTCDGRFLSFEFPNALSTTERSMLEALYRPMEMVLTNKPTSPDTTWEAEQSDGTGQYRAKYAFASNEIIKEVQEYRLVHTNQGGTFSNVKVLHSKTRFLPSRKHVWVDHMSLDDGLVFYQKANTPSLSVRIQSTLQACPLVENPALDIWDAHTNQDILRSHWQRQVMREEAPWIADARHQRRKAFEAQGGVDRLTVPHPENEMVSPEQLKELSEYLKSAPDQCAGLAQKLNNTPAGNVSDMLLIHALELAGHAEAQKELLAMAQNAELSQMNRMRAIVALGGITRAEPQTIDALWEFWDRRANSDEDTLELGQTALLSLGIIANAMPNTNQAAGIISKISTELPEGLSYFDNMETTALLMQAAGNAASETLAPTLYDYLASDMPTYRSIAAEALLKYDDTVSQKALTSALSKETVTDIRQVMANTLAKQTSTPEILTEVAAYLPTEENAGIRAALCAMIGRNVKSTPEAEALLRSYIKKETDTSVLKVIYTYIRPKRSDLP